MYKYLISIVLLFSSLHSFESFAKSTTDISSSISYANKRLDTFANVVLQTCKGNKQCSYNMFNKESNRLDKLIRKSYDKDTVGYTYHVMSLESLCNEYMKSNKELNKVFKEKICLVKYSYGQLKYMGIV